MLLKLLCVLSSMFYCIVVNISYGVEIPKGGLYLAFYLTSSLILDIGNESNSVECSLKYNFLILVDISIVDV